MLQSLRSLKNITKSDAADRTLLMLIVPRLCAKLKMEASSVCLGLGFGGCPPIRGRSTGGHKNRNIYIYCNVNIFKVLSIFLGALLYKLL